MDSQEFEQFKEFIQKLKYDIMSIEDYRRIFITLGGDNIIAREDSTHFVMWTMCHNENPYDGSKKLEFYFDNRVLTCYTKCCGSFDIIELVKKRSQLDGQEKSNYQCVKWICETLGIDFNFKSDKIEKTKEVYNWKSSLSKYLVNGNKDKELKVYDKNIINFFPKIYHTNFINDGISIHTMEKYNIRYYPYKDAIVIPVYSIDLELLGIRVRNTNPQEEAKYCPLRLLDGSEFKFPTNSVLYGINHTKEGMKHRKKAMLVESEKGVMQAEEFFGHDNFTVGLFGSQMSKEKRNLILEQGVNEVIVHMDFDYSEVGDNKEFNKFKDKIYKIGDYFKGFCKVSALITYEPHELKCNALDMGKDMFIKLYEEREELY